MKEDVLDKIIEVCESSIKSLRDCKKIDDVAITSITSLTIIIGICGGAKSALKEKKMENKYDNI